VPVSLNVIDFSKGELTAKSTTWAAYQTKQVASIS
jgi:hypothetical protein